MPSKDEDATFHTQPSYSSLPVFVLISSDKGNKHANIDFNRLNELDLKTSSCRHKAIERSQSSQMTSFDELGFIQNKSS